MTDPKLISRRTDAMPKSAPLPAEGAGTVSDAVIRRIGASLLAGETPGIAIIMGSADCAAHVSLLTGIYADMGLSVFAVGEAGADARPGCVSVGVGCAGLRNALQALERMAEIFCGVSPESGAEQRKQGLSRLPAFFNVPEHPDEEAEALLQTAEALGIPVLRELGAAAEPEALARRSLEARGVKLMPKAPALPVCCDSAFEGERVREPDCGVEFPTACELVRMLPESAVEDHRITLLGRDVTLPEQGYVIMHLAIAVEVSGKRMQPEFESVIEHRIHSWLCWVSGVEHRGRRDQVCLRLSRGSLAAGLRLTDLAELLYYRIRTEFEPVVDRCQITFITDAEASVFFLEDTALPRYQLRDERLAALTDESVDTFYSCTMCQSIAPHHCCIVTPERSGMCGAVTWPDAKAAFELSDSGPNRPIRKGTARDARLGAFDAVDHAAAEATGGAVQQLSLYSLIENPMTGCGRLECICCVEPLSGGVILVDRDYAGMTPVGMPFEELAAMVFGGEQTPGFLGVGRQYITSPKFIRADGGAPRIVWMTKKLKNELSARLNRTVREQYDIEDFCGMVCDETVTTDPEELLAFLTEKGHPVLSMEPIM